MRNALSDLLASGVALFGQGSRILKLRFPENSRIPEDTLLPHRLAGEEALSKNYRYTLTCLSPDVHFGLKELLGQPVEIALLLPDGGQRLLTGLVTRAEHQGADGGFAKYSLTVEPALATLALRQNSRVFQDKSVPEIVAAILDEHLAANPAFTQSFRHRAQLSQTYPPRSYCLQYRESDLAFIERLLFEEGISYRYTHGPDPETSLREGDSAADSDSAENDTPIHTLILFDANHHLPESARNSIRFHRTAGIESEDAIDQWTGSRQIQSGATQLASFDYKAVSTHTDREATRSEHGNSGNGLTAGLEDYDPQAGYYGSDPDEIWRYAKLRQKARDLAGKTFAGQGSVRSLQPGTWFELQDHPIHDQNNPEDRQFLVTGLSFEAENNLTPDAKNSLGGLLAEAGANTDGAPAGQNRPPYRNSFTTVRRHIPVVPDYTRTQHQKPTAGGLTTATVVGPGDEEIFTDEHGRIKIQFHWQRTQDHPNGGADKDDHSSTWVRVAMPSAGANWGTQYIPRIGQEVVIDFIEGDIDRPLATGVVYNGSHRPPTFSGAGTLPATKTLSGTKSKEYKGSRYNELLFDDSTNEIRAKLSSEHAKTQLNQGYLIHPRTEGKGEPRGEGFELRTDEAGTLRAAKGLLISTDARLRAQGKQLDRAELIGIVQVLESLQQQLAELANTHQADETDTKKLTELKQHVENWEKGSNTEGGQPDVKGGQPIIAVTAPAGFVAGSQANLALLAESHIDLVSNQNIQMSAGRRWLVRAVESISLFVDQLHLKLTTGKGKILLQANNSNIEATAAKHIVLTALEGMTLQSPVITLIANGAQIRIGDGAITTQCTGTHEQKAALHELTGPAGGSVSGVLPSSQASYDEKFKLRFPNGKPMANLPASIKDGKGKLLWSGITNALGEADLLKKDLPENLKIEFKDQK